MPGVSLERSWRLGEVRFLPLAAFIDDLRSLPDDSAVAAKAVEAVKSWPAGSVAVVPELDHGLTDDLLAIAISVFRRLVLKQISVNAMEHRFGIEGEVSNSARRELLFNENGVMAHGFSGIDAPWPVTVSRGTIEGWEADGTVRWLAQELFGVTGPGTPAAKRLARSLCSRDRAFLEKDLAVRSIHIAVALEILLGHPDRDMDKKVQFKSDTYGIGSRSAFLTCPSRDDSTTGVCPYAASGMSQRTVKRFAEDHCADGEWRCSGMLSVVRPECLDFAFRDPSIFSVRNEAAHTGQVTCSEKQVVNAFYRLDETLDGYISWAHAHHPTSLSDLDDFIANEVESRGLIDVATTTKID